MIPTTKGHLVMRTTQLREDNFDEITLSEGICLIDCWAAWCQGCKDFTPIFEAASDRHPTAVFATLDTGVETELTSKLGVKHIPTLILFRDGILMLRQPGHVPAEGLDEIVEKARALDMDHVRSEMEKEKASTPSE